MRRATALVYAILGLMLCGPARAAVVQVGITTRSGDRAVTGVASFDNKPLKFKLKEGKQSRELPLSAVARLEFAPFDSVQHAIKSDSMDVFLFRDGNRLNGVFRDMDGDEVFALMGAAKSEQRYKLATLVSVDLSETPLEVDRRVWGKGGFEFLNNALESLISTQAAFAIESEMPIIDDKPVNDYLNTLGLRLAAGSKRPDLPYQFRLVNQKAVNAFTVGGGQVYVYRGLVEKMANEAELAGVLAHEIGHNVGRHTIRALYKQMLVTGLVTSAGELAFAGSKGASSEQRRMLDLVTGLITSKYGREDEREADYLGTYNLYQRGYDPAAMVGVFETLKQYEARSPDLLDAFLASHPTADERIENVSAELQRLDKSGGVKDSPEFQTMRDRLKELPRAIGRLYIVSDTLDVPGLERNTLVWELKDTTEMRPVIKGTFRAFGGGSDDVRAYIFGEMDYLNFRNGHAATPLFETGRLTTAALDVRLPGPGKYYFVFDNTFSLMTPKKVDVQYYMEFEQ